MAEQLSPEAQAVLDAYRSSHLSLNNLAAAIEALADQVVPEDATPWNSTLTPVVSAREVRSQILALAAELRGQGQPSSDSD